MKRLLSIMLAGAIITIGSNAYSNETDGKNTEKQCTYEYKLVFVNPHNAELTLQFLNKRGSEGWKVVAGSSENAILMKEKCQQVAILNTLP